MDFLYFVFIVFSISLVLMDYGGTYYKLSIVVHNIQLFLIKHDTIQWVMDAILSIYYRYFSYLNIKNYLTLNKLNYCSYLLNQMTFIFNTTCV